MITVSNIITREISEVTSPDSRRMSFSIKASVENNSGETEVAVCLQGLDSEGFEIYRVYLEGRIPIGEDKVLTTKEDDVDKKLFEQIVKWEGKEWQIVKW